MEEKSAATDMISMSRPSRDNRASKNPKGSTSETSNPPPPPSKKSQIRGAGGPPASKKAKTGGESLVVASSAASNKADTGGSGRGGNKTSSNGKSLGGVVSRSKRAAAENGGDVTLDALRPAKKRKISSRDSAAAASSSSPPLSSAGQVKRLKPEGENGKHTIVATSTTTTTTATSSKAPPPDYALTNPKSGGASADIINTEEIEGLRGSGSAQRIGSRVAGTPNGLSGEAVEKRKEDRALRPRPKPTAPKVKKRTRFHEVKLGEGEGPRIVGRRIKVFWPLENRYFYGHVKAFNGARKLQHKIVYDDKDEEWLRLQNEVFGIELVPGEVFGGPAASASATEASTAAVNLDDSNELTTGDPPTAADDGGADIKSVEEGTGGEGRIKPEGVYRRKRKAERTSEETSQQQLEGGGINKHEKELEGERSDAAEKGEGHGEAKKEGGEGDDGKPQKKTKGGSEPNNKSEGKRVVRKKGEANSNKQRRTLAEKLGSSNAKRSSGNSGLVEQRRKKKRVQVVTRGRRRDKAVMTEEGSSGRRKRLGKEKVRNSGSSVQTRTRFSNLAENEEDKKALRNRIRDDDRLVTCVKSSDAVIRPKVAETKRSKEAKALRSSISDAKKRSSRQTQIDEENIAVDDEKLPSSFASNVRDRKQEEDPGSSNKRGNALGPFEAVMDAYREALTGAKDVLNTPANRGGPEEEPSAEAVREDGSSFVEINSFGLQDHGDEEGLGEALDDASRWKSGGASSTAQLTSRSGSAAAAASSQLDDNRHQAGNEAESDVLLDGQELSAGAGRRIIGEVVSTTEVVLTYLTPHVTPVSPELKKSPDKVYFRVKKYHPVKVIRRLKRSGNKVHNEGFDKPAHVPQIVVPVPEYWSLARAFLPSTAHVLSYGARIAGLGSSLQSFDRIASFNRPQCRSGADDGRLQLGTFFGAPSVHSLLRVSWCSLWWLFPLTSVSVNEVEHLTSSVSVRKIRMSAWSTANRRFKLRGLCSRRAFQHTTRIRQFLDPDLKYLSFYTRYFRGLGIKRLGSFPRRSSPLAGAPRAQQASVPHESYQGLFMSSAHLTPPPHGEVRGHLCTGQLFLSSDALRRSLTLFNPWISSRSSTPTNVFRRRALEAGARTRSLVRPVTTLSGERNMSGMEVGAYYGRRTLQSFLRVTRNESFRMNVRFLSFTPNGCGAISFELRSVLRAIADMHAAGGGAGDDNVYNVSQAGLVSIDSRDENAPSLLSRTDTVFEPRSRIDEIQFLGPWLIDPLAFNFQSACFDLRLPRYGGAIPRSLRVNNEYSLSTDALFKVFPTFESDCSVHPDQVAASEASLLHARREGTRSLPVILNRDALGDFFTSAAKIPTEVQGGDLDTHISKIGTYYGLPSIESLLRVSKDFWLRLLAAQRKTQPVNDVSATSVTPNKAGGGALPRPQSSMETIDDDEISDQEDRIQVEGTAGRQEPSVVGEDLDSIKANSRSFGPMKKGRRTGKGLKRGFAQSGGDSLGRDGVGVDRSSDGDLLSGRPYSKRTRVEIESSGAATSRDNGVEFSPSLADLDRKGFASFSSSAQEKLKGSALPRVNVLKLRRCPTNKGVWLVAGNSCAAPQDLGMRATGVEAEPSGPSDSREFVAGGDPVTPVFETSRKRTLDQCLESPALGRNDHAGTPGAITTMAVGNTASSADSQDLETTAAGAKSTKGFALHVNSPEVWFDSGAASVNGGIPDGLETRKRQRKGPSPIPGDDVDGTSEHSARRSADPGWGTCTANVLITKADRCVRETGAVVKLQSGHGNNYMLTVSLHGESKYALKADQPVASGTTNKFTHSMMWRGGKAWSLEFMDRKQWQLFKDLYEECFQRNARAASVRHIPIPGVKPIQEGPKSGFRFVRPALKYIRQFDSEVEMAFSSPRIIYDMDSEDEEWLNQINNEQVSARGTRSRPKVDEDTLERVMDKLEKTSFIRQQDPMSAEVALDLCQALGSQDAIKIIHSYWSDKRQRRGMALVRHFQPAPWEQYQKQLQEWQAKVDRRQQQSPTASKQQLHTLCKRPPLFAFCLRPRGLERRNKMQKQRSQRKQGLGGSSSRQWTVAGPPSDFYFDSPSKRQPSVESAGGPLYGPRKFLRQRVQEDNFSDPMAVDLSDSFNAIAGEGFEPLAESGQAISEGPALVFPRVESSSALQFETSTTAGFNKRTKKLGRKAKKMKLVAAAEESKRKRQLRAQQGHLNGQFMDMAQSPQSLSEMSPFPVVTDPSTSGVSVVHMDGQEEDKLAQLIAAQALAKSKREAAVILRSRAQALHAVADAAMHKAVAAVIAADAIHAAERAVEEAGERENAQPVGTHRQQTGEVPVIVKDDLSLSRPWGRTEASGGGASFGSWRKALKSASKNANHMLSKGTSSKPGLVTDMDDALLPVASWSQELGAGLGTRLLQTGEVSPQRHRYSPVLVEGLSKSPARGVRGGEGLVSLGRTRGESMMAMLTR